MSDSSSTVDTVGMLSRDIDRGTSSLQFSDSDIEVGPGMETEVVRSGRNRQSRMQEYRSRRGGADHLGIESDSFTETASFIKASSVSLPHSLRLSHLLRLSHSLRLPQLVCLTP